MARLLATWRRQASVHSARMPAPLPQPHRERPLNRTERWILVFCAATVMLLCYAFALTSITLLCVLLGVEVLLVLVAARFGLVGLVGQILERHLALAAVFFRCIRLARGLELGFSLERAEAPRLFEVIEKLCAKLQLVPPSVIWIENGANAYVQMKGLGRGAGQTVLGLGYDFLAGMTEAELESVLAHEMAHAKLVQRGLRAWLMRGMTRLAMLANGLSGYVSHYRRLRRTALLAEVFLWATSGLTSLAARLVAGYSRQDEFDADRTAAALCGVAVMRASLRKSKFLAEFSARLPWRERVAQLQAARGFSRWLLEELAAASSFTATAATPEVFNEYSTHPALADRLAALGDAPEADVPASSGIALAFLANPDAVADKLVRRIQTVVAEEEKKDVRALRRLARKLSVGVNVRWLQLLAIALVVTGLALGVIGGFDWLSSTVMILCSGCGVLLWRLGRYKDRLKLPSPPFRTMQDWTLDKQPEKRANELEAGLRKLVQAEERFKARTQRAVQECYAALEASDYLRADVAARYVLGQCDSKSVEAMMALCITSAALGDFATSSAMFAAVQKHTGFKSAASAWAAGWTLALAGDWMQSEAMLQRAVALRPEDATVHALLALVQSRRGKCHSAIESARRASRLKPGNNEYARQLTMLLLEAGFVREAQPRLLAVQQDAAYDSELAMAMVRLHLTLGQQEQAEKWTATVKGFAARPDLRMSLGHAYEQARKAERATVFYRESLETCHYPEAWLGLGRIEALKGNKIEAERCFLAALDAVRVTGPKGLGWLDCFPQVLARLVGLQEPVQGCRGWIATLPNDWPVTALNGSAFLVFAHTKSDAEHFLGKIFGAISDQTPSHMGRIQWREAPRDQQPVGPVCPGVQCLI